MVDVFSREKMGEYIEETCGAADAELEDTSSSQ